MAKAKKEEPISLFSDNPEIPRPRLSKLVIRNFRCIGPTPVEIDLNDIVVLVGSNNVGKSSILKAYEVVMSHGSAKGKLTLADFPNNQIDSNNLPEIELHTIIYDDKPGQRWIEEKNGENLVRERWTWASEGDPKRQGWDTETGNWSDNVPWGAPNIAKAKRPEPHRVDAFDPPEKQAEEIKKLLKQMLEERVKTLKASEDEESDYKKLLDQIRSIQKRIVKESQEEINKVNAELSEIVSKIFPNYKVDFDAKPEDNLDNTINLFKADSQLLMGPEDGYLSSIDRQGSGARRTLLWAALKFISENGSKKPDDDNPIRPHLLLLDEPEICLHPTAIREACQVLYDLPQNGNWQVVVTTHSPIFIDFSRDNTTIVRVEKMQNGEIQGTTVFRPDKVNLDEDDRQNLKLLNQCDPYVAEFFFGGNTIIVEGDTEYTALKYIIAQDPEKYKNVHIIRARGKATIISLVKILNHFGSHYSILHDSDTPTITTKNGEQTNGAWTTNQRILDAVKLKPKESKIRLLASILNFERAYFGKETYYDKEKPYNALVTIKKEQDKFETIEKLLKALMDHASELPQNCVEWDSLDNLEIHVQRVLDSIVE